MKRSLQTHYVALIPDQAPLSIKHVDLSAYQNIMSIVVENTDAAGLGYDNFHFDTPNGHVYIDFSDGIPTSEWVTFPGCGVTSDFDEHVLCPPGGWTGTLTVNFTEPVNNLQFAAGWVNTSSPSQFGTVTIYTSPQLLELTVVDANFAENRATAIEDGEVPELYVGEDAYGYAEIDVSGLFEPNTTDAADQIYLTIERSDGVIIASGYWDEMGTKHFRLPVSDQARTYTLTAWLDENQDGLCAAGEEKREVEVTAVTLGDLTVSEHGEPNNSVNATDDTIHDLCVGEDNKYRLHIDLTVDFTPGDGTGQLVRWMIEQSNKTINKGDFATTDTLSDTMLNTRNDTSVFTITAWLDKNQNGQYDGGEAKREIHVHDTTFRLKDLALPNITIVNGKLRVTVVKGRDYERQVRDWAFKDAMAGNPSDTDSAQIAIRWTDLPHTWYIRDNNVLFAGGVRWTPILGQEKGSNKCVVGTSGP